MTRDDEAGDVVPMLPRVGTYSMRHAVAVSAQVIARTLARASTSRPAIALSLSLLHALQCPVPPTARHAMSCAAAHAGRPQRPAAGAHVALKVLHEVGQPHTRSMRPARLIGLKTDRGRMVAAPAQATTWLPAAATVPRELGASCAP